jgi:GNAT superfamily N-acetyltransferase
MLAEFECNERDRQYTARAEDYVGSPAQREMQSRAFDLWRSIGHDPRYAYEGRLVALHGAGPDVAADILRLARNQGAAVIWNLPRDTEDALTRALRGRGYATDRWDQYQGGKETVRAAIGMRGAGVMPDGYELRMIGGDTSDAVIADFAGFAAEHGVMVPAAHVMRGLTRACAAMYATMRDGRVVAIAGSVLGHHRDSELAASAWWGMLCTHPEHRGRGLSKMLGAMTILEMAERHGATSFYTGVHSDNLVSQAVCNGLGIRRTENSVLMIISPELSGNGPVTR